MNKKNIPRPRENIDLCGFCSCGLITHTNRGSFRPVFHVIFIRGSVCFTRLRYRTNLAALARPRRRCCPIPRKPTVRPDDCDFLPPARRARDRCPAGSTEMSFEREKPINKHRRGLSRGLVRPPTRGTNETICFHKVK